MSLKKLGQFLLGITLIVVGFLIVAFCWHVLQTMAVEQVQRQANADGKAIHESTVRNRQLNASLAAPAHVTTTKDYTLVRDLDGKWYVAPYGVTYDGPWVSFTDQWDRKMKMIPTQIRIQD